MARVTDQSERYDDMIPFLTDVIKSKGEDLNTEERNVLSVGFKNLISSKRSVSKKAQSNKAYAFPILELYKRHYLRTYFTAEWRNMSSHFCRHSYRHRRFHRWLEPIMGSIIFIFIYYKYRNSRLCSSFLVRFRARLVTPIYR